MNGLTTFDPWANLDHVPRRSATTARSTGNIVGFKPAGGMKKHAKDALNWQVLMAEELGRDWLRPGLFRLGASSMLADIERQLEHHVTGRYAASHRHALA